MPLEDKAARFTFRQTVHGWMLLGVRFGDVIGGPLLTVGSGTADENTIVRFVRQVIVLVPPRVHRYGIAEVRASPLAD